MSTYTYPHTIENGAGERLTFMRRVQGPAGDRLEVENPVKPGSGPPMHVHHHQQEALTIRQGRIGYQRPGEPPQFAESGQTVVFKSGEAHRFWNEVPERVRHDGGPGGGTASCLPGAGDRRTGAGQEQEVRGRA